MSSLNHIGHVNIELTVIDSTNNYAIRLIDEGLAEHGMTISAEYQSAGKGQLGNVWFAEESKNLLFTTILDMSTFEVYDQFLLNKMICICLVELLEDEFEISQVAIKWPNDIYAGTQKIAGVLIENILRGSDWKYAIIGIGLNVNQDKFQELNRATSILLETSKRIPVNRVMRKLVKLMNQKYNDIKKEPNLIDTQFTEKLYGIHKPLPFKRNNEMHEGIVRGVDNEGRLLLEINGKLKKYKHKEIEFLLG